jgi:16S rRNA (adenine1518-N6/adenine1519-N6)-dimethyltransferase
MIKPKKSLGQNFLKSKETAARIVDCLHPEQADHIVEIGPGTGVLTEALISSGASVYAIDIDSRMTNFLSQKLAKHENLQAIHADILEFNLKSLAHNNKIKVIGNLPYHLTAPILERLFENHNLIETAILTVQKEVANRMVAEVGNTNYSSLTIFVNNFCTAQQLFDLSAKQFHPPPKVTSSVVKLDFYDNPVFTASSYINIRQMIVKLFSQRRKMVVNSLMKAYSLKRDKAVNLLTRAEIDSSARPQNISLEKYGKLIKTLEHVN